MRFMRTWPIVCMVSACVVWIVVGFFVYEIGGPVVSYDDNGIGSMVFIGNMVAFNILRPGLAVSRQLQLREGGLAQIIVAAFVCLALAWILDRGLQAAKAKWLGSAATS